MAHADPETDDREPGAGADPPPRPTADELHDAVSQSLVALALQARAAARTLEVGDPDAVGRAQAALADITHLSHSALAQMGALRVELGADGITTEGLVPALRRHAAALAARDGVVVEVDGPEGRLPLAAATEDALYRRGQAAVGAVLARTAGPVWIAVAERDGSVVVEVGGDGTEPIRATEPALGVVDQRAHP